MPRDVIHWLVLPTLRILTTTSPSLSNSPALFMHNKLQLTIFAKRVIYGVLKGQHGNIVVFCCSFIWIHLAFLLCLRPWEVNFGRPRCLVELHIITLPFLSAHNQPSMSDWLFHLPRFLSRTHQPPWGVFLGRKENPQALGTVRIRASLCELLTQMWPGSLGLWSVRSPFPAQQGRCSCNKRRLN